MPNIDYLAKARSMYKQLGQPNDRMRDADTLRVSLLNRYMEQAGVGYDQLDPESGRDDAEMRQVVKGFADKIHIEKAQNFFRLLKDGSPRSDVFKPEFLRQSMDNALEKAGADYSVLDASGKEGAMVMRYQVGNAERGAHLRRAINKFTELQEGLSAETLIAVKMVGGEYTTATVAQEVRDSIRKSGQNFSALDPSGEKSDREMRAEVDRLGVEAKIEIKDEKVFRDIVRNPPSSQGMGR